ncbi:DUF6366 family protein [Bacillus cereus group sp. TH43LC]|uniref:DUF6366 family protein n=1 Tax=Bacillus cereus group TaxID=86661 RepID=UPI00016B87F4|nr:MULTISPECIES: DUF6366 family protein [Bacillus cereus group]EDZ56796.1 conserved hypothetical protein [Bacillus cereus H3081.97]EJP91999.1 hypothetical protein IAU_03485 [Bacillus cereus IS075]EOO92620.1 hypothetical protein IGS_00998 [Bacillus cereus IS845/00]EOO98489.1 hypothetical protein IGQ_01001 [Bacillus cereus IS195]KLA05892.1 hypothetical protein B4086_4884 [Bacillus cereus]
MDLKKTPEEKREHMRQKELKNNPTGTLNDGLKRAESGSPVDLSGGMNWKGTGGIILILILGYIIYTYFFS